jgi:hypothetical protein
MKAPCPVCFHTVHQCADGTVGLHWVGFKEARRRCRGGRQPYSRVSAGRRVTVTVDLVLPANDWDIPRARGAITAAIRDHCPELFSISVDVEEEQS